MGGRRTRDRVVLFWSSVWFGAACAAPVSAQNVIPAYDSGWYDVTGFHDPGNTNFICGLANVLGAGGEFRNFFRSRGLRAPRLPAISPQRA